jgi:hypothetical protein
MERKTSNSGVVAALETPTGLRFPSIEASRPAAAPVLDEYFGFMYIGEMLKEWRMNKEEVTLERLLAEASNDHLLWEAERANQELILFVNRERVVDKILQYAFSSNEASPQSSPSKMDAQQPPQITPAEIKSFCQDLLSLEVRQGGVFDDSGQTRIIHHLFSSFFTPEDEDGKPRFRAPPPEAGTLLQVLAYRPQSREKVLSYLVDTPAEMFVDFFLVHLDHLIVSDVLTTLVSLLSEAPPSAWLPTGGPRVLQLPLSEFDVSPSLVDAFNEWLIAGSFVDRVIATILRPDDGDGGGDKRRRAEITEKAFGLLGQVVMIARSHLHIGQDPPPIFYELMEETRLRPFLRSILKHQNDKVVGEGLALLSSLLVCDRMSEAEKRKRAEEEAEESASNNQQPEAASSTASSSSAPSSEMQAAAQSHGDLLPRLDGKADDGSAFDRRSGKSESDQVKMPESHFNEVLVEVLRDSLPALVMRLRPEGALEAGKPDWQRETDAKQAESDAMVEQRRLERKGGGEATITTTTTTTNGKQQVQTLQRKRPFGLLRLKIAESMRALVLHFTVPSADDTLAEAFFTLLKSLKFPTLLVELLIDNPRMDILHTVIIQTLKPILVKDKPRSFLHAVVKEGSFIRQIVEILPLCGLTRSSPDGELTALRPPVKEIMNSLTRTSLSDPDLTSLLDDQGWWDQAVSTNSAGPAPPASAMVPFA